MKIARLVLLMMLLATVSALAVQSVQSGGGTFGASAQGGDTVGGSNSTACTEFWIDCDLDGAMDEWCCATLDMCLAYCEEACGVPCVYNEN